MTRFLDAATAWEGTPWAPSGAQLGKRSNCVGYLVRALEASGHGELAALARPAVNHEAPPQASSLARWCDENLQSISKGEAAPGDLLLFRFKGTPCHMAVLLEPGVILDCNTGYGKVCRNAIPVNWVLRGAYRLP